VRSRKEKLSAKVVLSSAIKNPCSDYGRNCYRGSCSLLFIAPAMKQMKVVMPPTSPTPVMETNKDLFSEQTTKLSEADKTVVKEKFTSRKARGMKKLLRKIYRRAVAW